MESTLIRGFVLFLAMVGFGASTTTHPKSMDDGLGGAGAPTCPINSGQFCGLQ